MFGTHRPHRYWSLYASMDEQDISRLWNPSGLNHIILSAKVNIPLRGRSIRRSIPLYSIENGVIQSHSGVDLLKRIPIHDEQREQVEVTLEVRYLPGAEAMRLARNIIKQSESVALAFATQLEVATSIVSNALDLVDGNTEGIRSNSITTSVRADTLRGNESVEVYLLRSPDDPRATYGDGNVELVVCHDKDDRLCAMAEGPLIYRTHRISDVAYVMFRYRASNSFYDPELILTDGQSCESISAGRIDQLRAYLAKNSDMFTTYDIETATAARELASDLVTARDLVDDADVAALLDILARHPVDEVAAHFAAKHSDDEGQVLQLLDTVRACYVRFWTVEPAKSAYAAWLMLRTPTVDVKSRLNAVVAALKGIATLEGTNYEPDANSIWSKSAGQQIQVLHYQAVGLIRDQEAEHARLLATNQCDREALARFSAYCGKCQAVPVSCRGHRSQQTQAEARVEGAKVLSDLVEKKLQETLPLTAPRAPQ